MMFSNRALLRILAKRGQAQIFAIAAMYGITQLMSCPFNLVKRQVFSATYTVLSGTLNSTIPYHTIPSTVL